MHGCLFKHIHIVKLETLAVLADDPLTLDNTINTFLYNLIII